MKLFHKEKMGGEYWAVFLVNPNNSSDRRMVSSALEKECLADDWAANCNRIVEAAYTAVEIEELPAEPDSEIFRAISLKDL